MLTIIIQNLLICLYLYFLILMYSMLLFCYRSDASETKKNSSKHENAVKYGELIILG